MTLSEFKNKFYCEIDIRQDNQFLKITSQVLRRSDDKIIDTVKTEINIHNTNNWIIDSHSTASLNSWTWPDMIEKAKRGQVDYFCMRANIQDFYPLNSDLVLSIDDFYIK
jgi:hypothetical protein